TVVLLVDADQPEPAHRREDRGARADHDTRLARGDPLALVPALGLAEARVQDGDAVAEPRLEATERLRCQRDLGDEHDRAEPALEHRGAGAQIHLGLARAGRPRSEEHTSELQSLAYLVCRLLLEKKKKK